MVDSKLFVAGVTTSVFLLPECDNVCSTELWYLDLIKLKWYKVLDSGIEKTAVLHPGRLCRLRARAFGDKIVTVAQNTTDNFDEYARQYELQPERVVSFSLSKWTVQSDNIPFAADNLYSWRDKVCASVSIKTARRQNDLVPAYLQTEAKHVVSAVRPGCFAGEFAANWSKDSCAVCPARSYAQSGSFSCTACPKCLTTLRDGAVEQFNCVCEKDYCGKHTNCFVVSTNRQLSAQCQCGFGYTDSINLWLQCNILVSVDLHHMKWPLLHYNINYSTDFHCSLLVV